MHKNSMSSDSEMLRRYAMQLFRASYAELWLINKDLTLSGMWIIIAITFHITEVSNENRTNDP